MGEHPASSSNRTRCVEPSRMLITLQNMFMCQFWSACEHCSYSSSDSKNNKIQNYMPVSYTHLDVYKRQPVDKEIKINICDERT